MIQLTIQFCPCCGRKVGKIIRIFRGQPPLLRKVQFFHKRDAGDIRTKYPCVRYNCGVDYRL
jgi:hypothetical protein